MEDIALVNPENVSEDEANRYPVREAARAVVIDADGMIALLHVSRDHYYKLPGGGIEEAEDRIDGLRREHHEEIGCEIEIIGEIGCIVEYRKMFNLKQISYCYFAKVKGQKSTPHFEKGEVEEGFEVIWLPYDEALRTISSNEASTFEGKEYIVPRDVAFLKAAKEFLH